MIVFDMMDADNKTAFETVVGSGKQTIFSAHWQTSTDEAHFNRQIEFRGSRIRPREVILWMIEKKSKSLYLASA
jgi:hypothetical protein